MKIRDLLQGKGSQVFTISAETTVEDAVKTLNERRVGALIVTAGDGSVTGILSERDILHHMNAACEKRAVKEIMTPGDKIVIGHEDDDVEYAMNMFTEHRIRHLPVFRERQLVGVVSIGDVVKALLDNAQYEKKSLMDYITGSV